jgi:hypothetical protein
MPEQERLTDDGCPHERDEDYERWTDSLPEDQDTIQVAYYPPRQS